jgi:hypothetical protein
MTETPISRDDIDALAQGVDALTLPQAPRELLDGIISAIRTTIGDEQEPVTVTVVVGPSVQDDFDAAYTPDAASTHAAVHRGVKVTVNKIGR